MDLNTLMLISLVAGIAGGISCVANISQMQPWQIAYGLAGMLLAIFCFFQFPSQMRKNLFYWWNRKRILMAWSNQPKSTEFTWISGCGNGGDEVEHSSLPRIRLCDLQEINPSLAAEVQNMKNACNQNSIQKRPSSLASI